MLNATFAARLLHVSRLSSIHRAPRERLALADLLKAMLQRRNESSPPSERARSSV
jgi:hypothetical protein